MAQDIIPTIIQGGMGAGVSNWQLARAVSIMGQLGVVSGTALDVILARRLQLGDSEGHVRRVLDYFPYPKIAERVLRRYFVPGGKRDCAAFRAAPMGSCSLSRAHLELIVVANFAEVFLAREGHQGQVGINYLEKIQWPTLPSLFGAMLAGVDYVLMGAGIPLAIPGILDQLAEGQPVQLAIRVERRAGKDSELPTSYFDPEWITEGERIKLDRPRFLAIVASATLASMLTRKAAGRVDGFVVEGPTAGGHNAPPRGALQLNSRGEPLYGDRDRVDLAAMRAMGSPFWLAGSYGSSNQLQAARRMGAAGIQVGTAFAFCAESGLRHDIKRRVLALAKQGRCDVLTDPLASPTGFPFKVLQLDKSLSDSPCYQQRTRLCDLGFLRQGYERGDGTIGWRCPGEPVEDFTRKGGSAEETEGRKCLCNALLANVGLGQVRGDGQTELPLVTCGDDVNNIRHFLASPTANSYSAADVIQMLLGHTGTSSESAQQVSAIPR